MPSETLTLVLEGKPTLDDLSQAVEGLRQVVRAIEQNLGLEHIAWAVVDLDSSNSAAATFRATGTDPARAYQVTDAYLDLGRQILEFGTLRGPFPSEAVFTLTGVLNGRVPAIRLETAEDEVMIRTEDVPPRVGWSLSLQRSQPTAPRKSLGGILGRVQTLSTRGALRFTLYDVLHDRAVTCYLNPGQEDQMRGVWDRLAVVRGLVSRDAETGRPLVIREIESVVVQPDGSPGGWRRARGVVRTATEEPVEDTIRRIRDAW